MERFWRSALFALFFQPCLCLAALNDTGQATCYGNDGRMLSCDDPLVTLLGQDGVHGRDVFNNQKRLLKHGSGRAGFDFVAMDEAGMQVPLDELGSPTDAFRCVRDEVTGLTWLLSESDSPDMNEEEAANAVMVAKAAAVCGMRTWRLPTLPDLLSVADFASTQEGIDSSFFKDARRGWFRTADRMPNSTSLMRVFGYQGGSRESSRSFALPVGNRLPVRLVSGRNPGPELRATARGSVVDVENSLEWDACVHGRHGPRCRAGRARHLDWPSAFAAAIRANAFAYKGHRDWRLPNVKELYSIVEQTRQRPAIDERLFPHTEADWFWSSTSRAGNLGAAHTVDFDVGQVRNDNKPESHYLRLVRDYKPEKINNR